MGAGRMDGDTLAQRLSAFERSEGRDAPSEDDVRSILADLAREGFIEREGDAWKVCD